MDITVSPAQPTHFPALRAIELAAFETLRDAGAVTGQPVANSLQELSDFSRDGLLFAAFTPDLTPVGFVAGKIVSLWLHIAEIDVPPHWQRRGIGRLLMQTVLSSGQQRGLAGATLTTDNMAAFNAKFYATLGFEPVEDHACPPHLRIEKAEDVKHGLNPARRVAMRLNF
ncbi:GNAT family N-acetyltransferase [Lelliottia amnigena]|uniref:GNAT family N-acetyltransferase n=1 Tax=Lelliottia amnigena TaxID=61646 RepID=UPI00192BEFBF|nr:GNAT family N-acetyltransferase [Lelliottia amnigena]MBL5930259.1 GNAT family N-acetyltransferase [Lelliottia amnigena]MBL5964069.1 GNAT family N-acetyltransferase [Lelliottia amnigena]